MRHVRGSELVNPEKEVLTVEIYTTKVAAAQMGAACPGVGSPWATLSAGVNHAAGVVLAAAGVNHALAQPAVLAPAGPDARLGAFRPDSAPMSPAPMSQAPVTQSALMTAELLPVVTDTRNQKTVNKTRINAGGYGAMGPHPERERLA
jgi:hypothetical protein